VAASYDIIPKSTQITEPMTMQKIDQIVQTIDQYRQEIENLWEKIIPTTPSEVNEQIKKDKSRQMDEMERQVIAIVDLFDREAKLWTNIEEDQQVQNWDQEEEKISASIQDLKKRQKMMKITECLKGMQDMNKLQEDLVAVQMQKKGRQAQMEPLQELEVEVIA
jgi:5'-deoxynucleotidase YfbR-like HD superfamily hydrolase